MLKIFYLFSLLITTAFSVNSFANPDELLLFNVTTQQVIRIEDLRSSNILASHICYIGNRSSNAVEIAHRIQNHNFQFENMEILSAWAEIYDHGIIELTWTFESGRSFSIFTGVSFIQNCEDSP